MKNLFVFLAVFAGVTLFSLNSCIHNEKTVKEEEKIEKEVKIEKEEPGFLAVMSGMSGSYDGEKLTLNDVPMVMYFSDRPWRISGNLSLNTFVDGWEKNYSNLETDPPNAIISIFNEDGSINVVVELLSVQMVGEAVQFNIKVLDGELPATLGATSLFIDPINQNGQWTGT